VHGLIPAMRTCGISPRQVGAHLKEVDRILIPWVSCLGHLQKGGLFGLLVTLDRVSRLDGFDGILEGFQVGEGVEVIRLQHTLLIPLVPGGDEVEILVDATVRSVAHVAEGLDEARFELLGAGPVALRAAAHAVVEASGGTPILRPSGDEVLVFPGGGTTATLADSHEMEGGVEETWHEARPACTADGAQEIDAAKAILLGEQVPVVHHRCKLFSDLLREVDCKDRLVVDLLVVPMLEVGQEVVEVLLPARLIGVVLFDQNLSSGVLAIATFPTPVGPGEEEGLVRLAVLQHQVGNLPHDTGVLDVLTIEPVVVNHEAIDAVLLGKLGLALANVALREVVVVQATLLRGERLA